MSEYYYTCDDSTWKHGFSTDVESRELLLKMAATEYHENYADADTQWPMCFQIYDRESGDFIVGGEVEVFKSFTVKVNTVEEVEYEQF